MTCLIASVKHGIVASDSRCSTDSSMVSVSKVRVIKQSIIGAAGDWNTVLKFWEIVDAGKGLKDLSLPDDAEIEVIELTPSGIYLYEPNGRRYKIKDQFYAAGSGGAYALGAMAMGATPEEAVAIASRFDPNTGGEVEVLQLGVVNGSKSKRR